MEKYRPFIIIYLILVSSVIYFAFFDWNFDDAFITFRYASNLAKGQGFVYNPGQQVLSTTTPLFTLLLAAASHIWSDLPHLANFFGAIGIGLGAFFLWEICLEQKLFFAGFTCLILYPTFPLLVKTIGLETSLYIAFCLGAILFYQRQRYSWSAVFGGLTCLLRPDGLILPVILLLHFVITQRRLPPAKPIVVFLVLLIPWLTFSLVYFGTPIPVSFVTKLNQGSMLFSERFAPGLITTLRPFSRRVLYVVEFTIFLVGLILIISRKIRFPIILFIWTAIYYLAFSILGVSRYPWYYAPLVPTFIISIGLGLTGLYLFSSKFLTKYSPRLPAILSTILLVLLGAGQFFQLMQLKQIPDPRWQIYRAISQWLVENTATTDLVGTLEVGIIGFYSSRPILDFAGLVQPEVGIRLGDNTTYEDSAMWAMENHQPQYVILKKGLFPVLESGFVPQHCHNVQRFDGIDYGYSGILDVYKCAYEK